MFWQKKKNDESSSIFDFPNADMQERQHSLIGYGVAITGEVRFAGSLRIDGRVDGRVDVKPKKRGVLVVSKDAVINGPVNVTNLIVDGTINGDIHASGRIECRVNGRIKGKIRYQNLTIIDGATVDGQCIKLDAAAAGTENVVVSVVAGEKNKPARVSSFLSKES